MEWNPVSCGGDVATPTIKNHSVTRYCQKVSYK